MCTRNRAAKNATPGTSNAGASDAYTIAHANTVALNACIPGRSKGGRYDEPGGAGTPRRREGPGGGAGDENARMNPSSTIASSRSGVGVHDGVPLGSPGPGVPLGSPGPGVPLGSPGPGSSRRSDDRRSSSSPSRRLPFPFPFPSLPTPMWERWFRGHLRPPPRDRSAATPLAYARSERSSHAGPRVQHVNRNPHMDTPEDATKDSPSTRTNVRPHASGTSAGFRPRRHSSARLAAAESAALPNARRSRRLTRKYQNSLVTRERSAPLRVRCLSARVARSITRGMTRYTTTSAPRLGRN